MSRSEDVELKPCPFCGGEGWIVVDAANTYQPPLWRPQCKACGGGPGGLDSKAEAIIAWNTRAPSALPVGVWKLELNEEMLDDMASKYDAFREHFIRADAMRAAVAMLSASPPEPVSGWRDIATAPRDRSIFLGAVDGVVRFVSWGKTSHVPIYGFCLADQGAEDYDLCEPSCWQPLPSPPSEPGVK